MPAKPALAISRLVTSMLKEPMDGLAPLSLIFKPLAPFLVLAILMP
jgi:hypothetical protein